MKRILFITHNFKGGGIQKITLDTARYLAQQGNDITLLALEEGLDFQLDFQCTYNVLPVKEFLYKHPFLGFYFIKYFYVKFSLKVNIYGLGLYIRKYLWNIIKISNLLMLFLLMVLVQ